MDNAWILELEEYFFSQIKTAVASKLQTTYSGITFAKTAGDQDSGYPLVLVHELPGEERQTGLNREELDAVLFQLRITVISKAASAEAAFSEIRKVMGEVINALKARCFEIHQTPEADDSGGTYKMVLCCRRLIDRRELL